MCWQKHGETGTRNTTQPMQPTWGIHLERIKPDSVQ